MPAASPFAAELQRFGPDAAEARPLSPARCRRYCRTLARRHYENFTVASWLLPRRLRQHFYNVYAYCRWADDLADETGDPARSLRLLDWWAAELDRCYAGHATHPVFVALAETVRRFDVPQAPFADLLAAFRQDQHVTRYETFDQLLEYCRRSANPVGRMVLHLFGYRDEERAVWSDAICTALQLTNFWQDVAIDGQKGRIYIPGEDRERHGVTEEEVLSGRMGPGFRGLLAELVERTRERFRAGSPLLHSVRGRLSLELRCVWLGGMRILERLEAGGFDPFHHRPTLTRKDALVAAGRALLGAAR